VLAEQARLYEELLELSQAKKEILVRNDADSLKGLNAREEEILCRYRKTERARISSLADLAREDGLKPEQVTLDWLIGKCADPVSRLKLEKIKSRLKEAAGSLHEANSLNMKLIKNNMEYIECTVNLLRSAGKPLASGSSSCQDESVFDARQ
jgi:hypothetical protein